MVAHKVIVARAFNKKIYLKFSDGTEGEFNFEDYFEYDELLSPLRDPLLFEQIQISDYGHNIFWPNNLDLDTEILYSIISQKPIIVENKVVFDPHFGKKGWAS